MFRRKFYKKGVFQAPRQNSSPEREENKTDGDNIFLFLQTAKLKIIRFSRPRLKSLSFQINLR